MKHSKEMKANRKGIHDKRLWNRRLDKQERRKQLRSHDPRKNPNHPSI